MVVLHKSIFPFSIGIAILSLLIIVVSYLVLPAKEVVAAEALTELTYLGLSLCAFYHMRKTTEPVILLGWSFFCLGLSLDLTDELVDVSGVIHKNLEDWICMSGIFLFAAGFNRKNRLLGSLLSQTSERANDLANIAYFDKVTGLANRESVLEHIQLSFREGREFNILFVDLDDFKPVNDTYGHEVGDLLLRYVGQRLQTIVRQDDIVSRWGGDEFLIFARDGKLTAAYANRIRGAFNDSFKIREYDIVLGASIGCASFPEHARCPSELINKADIAMYHAKSNNLGVVRYNASMT